MDRLHHGGIPCFQRGFGVLACVRKPSFSTGFGNDLHHRALRLGRFDVRFGCPFGKNSGEKLPLGNTPLSVAQKAFYATRMRSLKQNANAKTTCNIGAALTRTC